MQNTNRFNRRQALAGFAALALPAVAQREPFTVLNAVTDREQRQLRRSIAQTWPEGDAPLVDENEQLWLCMNDKQAMLTWEPDPERRLDTFFNEIVDDEWPFQIIAANTHTREQVIAKLRRVADALEQNVPLTHDGEHDGGTILHLEAGGAKVTGYEFWG